MSAVTAVTAASDAVTPETLKVGGLYNWVGQPERLVYMGTKHYPGDRRTWYQFALADKPDDCWCEVLDSDLSGFEETKPTPAASDDEMLPLVLATRAKRIADALSANREQPTMRVIEFMREVEPMLCKLHAENQSLRVEAFAGQAGQGHLGTLVDELRAEIESLKQQLAQRVPDGSKLVPVEPTDAMVQAAHHLDLSYMPGQEGADRAAIYRAMIHAAPAQPEQPAAQDEPAGRVAWAADVPNSVKEVRWTEYVAPPVGTPIYTSQQPASKPMTEHEILVGWSNSKVCTGSIGSRHQAFAEGVRFAERHHNIKERP